MENLFLYGAAAAVLYCIFFCGRSISNFDLLEKNTFRPVFIQMKTGIRNFFKSLARKRVLRNSKKREKVTTVRVRGVFVQLTH